jgi:hypothetical protein
MAQKNGIWVKKMPEKPEPKYHFPIPSTIARTKKFKVRTPKSGREFTIVWIRNESRLRPDWKGYYMQDTFVFERKNDLTSFTGTSFFKKNGLEVGFAYHDLGYGAKQSWFVKESEVNRRIEHRQFGPRQV